MARSNKNAMYTQSQITSDSETERIQYERYCD